MQKLTKQIVQNQRDFGTCYSRANEYYEKGDVPSALADLGKSIELQPNYPNMAPYALRALIYEKQKKYALALADANKYVELNVNSAVESDSYNLRAQIYCVIGLKPGAIVGEKKVVELGGKVELPCK